MEFGLMAGFITAEGNVIPAGSDPYDYVNDQRRLAASVRSIVPTANVATFQNVVAGMSTDGRPVSDTNPLFAWDTQDKGLVYQGTNGVMKPLGPAAPFGHMGRTAGFQTISSTTPQLVTCSAAQVLLNGMTFDSGTSSLVAPVTGYYRINYKGYATGGSPYMAGFITRINGVLQTQRAAMQLYKGNSQDYEANGTVIQLLNAGDKVSMWSFTDNNTMGSVWGTTGYDGIWLELEWFQDV